MGKVLNRGEALRVIKEIMPKETLTEGEIENLKNEKRIALFTPKINHNERDYILIIYNNYAGAVLYELNKSTKIYTLRKNNLENLLKINY
jgi:hypothetical protein